MLNHLKYPSIKEMFIPDPGFTFFDVDYAQADARVVAWDSGCKRLIDIFNDPDRDLHSENAITLFGKLTKESRQLAKNGVHAVNYNVKAKTLAVTLGISITQAQKFIDAWFNKNPEVYDWHQHILSRLYENGTIYNIWGFRRQYFDRIEHILSEALAWIGQSTVAITMKKAMDNLITNIEQPDPDQFQLLLQVHDSFLGQFRTHLYPEMRLRIRENMAVPIPYPTPLIIPTDIKVSRISWGHARKVPWEDPQTYCPF